MNPTRNGTGPAGERMKSIRGLCWEAAILAAALAGVLSLAHGFQGYQVVTTTDPVSESAFLASTTNQFNVMLSSNPYIGNTYTIKLFGPNPSFNPPVTNQQLLDSIVTVDSWTYVAGWVDGAGAQQNQDIQTVNNFTTFCSSAPYFALVTIDSTTCYAVAGALAGEIYEEKTSTPEVVPGNFQ